MDLGGVVRGIVLAPKRFLDWVYRPDPRHGPTRGQAVTHLIANGHGLDTSRWMRIEAEERRLQAALLRQRQREAARRSDPPG